MNRNYIYGCVSAILLAFGFIYSCGSHKPEPEKIYVISSLSKTDKSHFIIPHGEFFQDNYYQQFNFIVDSSGLLYYFYFQPSEYKKDTIKRCIPIIFYMRPGQIVRVPLNCTIDFLKGNVLNNKNRSIKISISSQKDTIKSKGFKELYDYLVDSAENVSFYVRPATIEENTFLYYKKSNNYYEGENVDWDSIMSTYYSAPIVVMDE